MCVLSRDGVWGAVVNDYQPRKVHAGFSKFFWYLSMRFRKARRDELGLIAGSWCLVSDKAFDG